MGACGAKTKSSEVKKTQRQGHPAVDQSMFITLNSGRIREHYSIGKMLGEGAFGQVMQVFPKAGGAPRAMKTIEKNILKKDDLEQMMEEVNILKQLDHPNIIKLYEFYQDANKYYLVTEHCSGGELFQKIMDMQNLSESCAASYLKEILSTLIYWQKQNIVHRDLKPENILLDVPEKGGSKLAKIKIIDFGTAIQLDPEDQLTQVIGTPYYMAPEVLKKKYAHECDVWSVGVILFIMLSGYPPFGGDDEREIFYNTQHMPLEFNMEEWRGISSDAKHLITRMLDKNPKTRISAQEAFNHRWVQNNNCDVSIDSKVLTKMNQFQSRNRLQSAIMTFLSSQMICQAEKNKLIDTFQALDKDGDGTLSRKELIQGFKQINVKVNDVEAYVDSIINSIDNNQSGIVDFTEFCVACANKETLLSSEKIKQAFKLFDQDGNGKISLKEMQNMMSGLGREEIMTMIQSADTNGDGEIDFDEFSNLLLGTK